MGGIFAVAGAALFLMTAMYIRNKKED
jgi:hypothetical protein